MTHNDEQLVRALDWAGKPSEHVLIPVEIPEAARHEIAMIILEPGRDAARRIWDAVVRQGQDILKVLRDPVSVHVNMLAGNIAKPDVGNILHLYGIDEQHIAALRARVAELARDALLIEMQDISEDQWSAGWLIGLEYYLWRALCEGPQNYIAQPTIDKLRILSNEAGGWWVSDEKHERQFVPMEEWERLYAATTGKAVQG